MASVESTTELSREMRAELRSTADATSAALGTYTGYVHPTSLPHPAVILIANLQAPDPLFLSVRPLVMEVLYKGKITGLGIRCMGNF